MSLLWIAKFVHNVKFIETKVWEPPSLFGLLGSFDQQRRKTQRKNKKSHNVVTFHLLRKG